MANSVRERKEYRRWISGITLCSFVFTQAVPLPRNLYAADLQATNPDNALVPTTDALISQSSTAQPLNVTQQTENTQDFLMETNPLSPATREVNQEDESVSMSAPSGMGNLLMPAIDSMLNPAALDKKTIDIQLIQVCDDLGSNCANPERNYFEEETKLTWTQAGIDVNFLDWQTMSSEKFMNLSVNEQDQGYYGNLLNETKGKSPETALRVFFVDTISSGARGLTFGVGMEIGMAIAKKTFEHNTALTLAHEIGNALGLQDYDADAQNLMHSPTPQNVAKDQIGVTAGKLTQEQIQISRDEAQKVTEGKREARDFYAFDIPVVNITVDPAGAITTLQVAQDSIAADIASHAADPMWVQPIYKVQIKAGTYQNNLSYCGGAVCDLLNVKVSGTAEAPIIFEPFGDGPVYLRGFGFEDRDLNLDGLADGPIYTSKRESLITISGNYVQVKGFDISNSQQSGISVLGSHNLVEGNIVHDNWTSNITIGYISQTTSDNVIRGNEVFRSRHGSGITLGREPDSVGHTTRTLIENNISYFNGYLPDGQKVLPIGGDPAGGGNSDGINSVKACSDNINPNAGVANLCTTNVMRGNIVYHNADDGFDNSIAESLLEYNISFDNGPEGNKGYKMLRNVDGMTYVGNIAYANPSNGFEFRFLSNSKVFNNMSVGNTGRGIMGLVENAANNIGFSNTSYGVIVPNDCPNCSSNLSDNGGGSDLLGDPLVKNAHPFRNLEGKIEVVIPNGLTIAQKVEWIRAQFRDAFDFSTGSPALNSGKEVTYQDPITGFSYTIDGTRLGPFGSIVPNSAPLMSALANQTVDTGKLLSFVVATDLNAGDLVTITVDSKTPLPEGAVIDGTTFKWTPAFTQAGTHRIKLIATDKQGLKVEQTFEIKVNYIPPIAIPDVPFGIEESVDMYLLKAGETCGNTSGKCFDFGSGLEPYKIDELGHPYTHYIDNSDPSSIDTANAFGAPGKPRKTIPLNLPAGAVILLKGGPYTYGNYNGNGMLGLNADGTAERPVFVRGLSINQPVVIERSIWARGHYMIMENVILDRNQVAGPAFHARVAVGDPIGHTHHITLRHSEAKNISRITSSSATVSATGLLGDDVTDFVVYANNIHPDDIDVLNAAPESKEKDSVGVAISENTNRVWILDNEIHHYGGDAVGAGHGDNYTSKNYFIGRNDMHDGGENGVDMKEVDTVIVSENKIHAMYGVSAGSDGTGIVAHYGPKYSPKNVWIINNELYDMSDSGIQVGGSQEHEVYIIGNIIHDIHNVNGTANGFTAWGSKKINIVGNIFYNNDNGIEATGNGSSGGMLVFKNNIMANKQNPFGYYVKIGDSSYVSVSDISHNLFYDPDDVSGYACTGCIFGDPKFVDAANGNFKLQEGSPAINEGTSTDLYTKFFDLFGRNINLDHAGNARVAGFAIDMGTFEYQGQGAEPTPDPVINPPQDPGPNNSSNQAPTIPATKIVLPGDALTLESAVLTAPMQKNVDGSISSTNSEAGLAEITVNVPSDGVYALWGRTLATAANHDSFYVSVDGQPEVVWHIPNSANWTWRRFISSSTTFNLTAGVHTITLRGRESQAKLGAMILTTDLARVPVDTTVSLDRVTSLSEDGTASFSLFGSDANGDTLSYIITTPPTHGTLTQDLSDPKVWHYTPTGNFNGADTFSYKVNDGKVDSEIVSWSITVNAVNDAPVLAGIPNQVVSENELLVVNPAGFDVDRDTLTFSVEGLPVGGEINPLTGVIRWKPNFEQAGSYDIVVKVSDGKLSVEQTVNIDVRNANRIPLAQVIEQPVTEDVAQTITLRADSDGEALTYEIIKQPLQGKLDCTNESCAYTSEANFNGRDNFWYRVSDGNNFSKEVEVLLNVAAVNDAPAAEAMSVDASEDAAQRFTLKVSDVDLDLLSSVITRQPEHGTIDCKGTECIYQPENNFNGADSFEFYVTDGKLQSATISVPLNVKAMNDRPVIISLTNESGVITETGSKQALGDEIVIQWTTEDIEGQDVTMSVEGFPLESIYRVDQGKKEFGWSLPAIEGTYDLKFTASDGEADSEIMTLQVSVVKKETFDLEGHSVINYFVGMRDLTQLLKRKQPVVQAKSVFSSQAVLRVDAKPVVRQELPDLFKIEEKAKIVNLQSFARSTISRSVGRREIETYLKQFLAEQLKGETEKEKKVKKLISKGVMADGKNLNIYQTSMILGAGENPALLAAPAGTEVKEKVKENIKDLHLLKVDHKHQVDQEIKTILEKRENQTDVNQ